MLLFCKIIKTKKQLPRHDVGPPEAMIATFLRICNQVQEMLFMRKSVEIWPVGKIQTRRPFSFKSFLIRPFSFNLVMIIRNINNAPVNSACRNLMYTIQTRNCVYIQSTIDYMRASFDVIYREFVYIHCVHTFVYIHTNWYPLTRWDPQNVLYLARPRGPHYLIFQNSPHSEGPNELGDTKVCTQFSKLCTQFSKLRRMKLS